MLKKLSPTSPWLPLVLLVILIASWIELDLYAPSFPQIMHHFGTTEQAIQLTLSLNFLGFFFSSLFCGPLADSFGRRPVLIGGCFLFLLGSLLCVFAPDMGFLLAGRFLQGIGVSGPVSVCMAVLADVYQGERQVRLLAMMNSTITIVMAMAPIVGVYLTEHFGWRSNFVVITMGAFIGAFAILFLLPETLDKSLRQPFGLKNIVSGYTTLLKDRQFMFTTLGLSFLVAGYFVFIGIIPLLFMEKLGVGLKEYGFYQGSVVGLFAIGSLCIPAVASRFDIQKLMRWGVILSVVAGVLLFILGVGFKDHPVSITLITWLYVIGLVLPCCMLFGSAIDMYPSLRASASSLIQSIRMLVMALATLLTGALYNGTFLPIGFVMMALLLIAFPMIWATLNRDSVMAAHPPLEISA